MDSAHSIGWCGLPGFLLQYQGNKENGYENLRHTIRGGEGLAHIQIGIFRCRILNTKEVWVGFMFFQGFCSQKVQVKFVIFWVFWTWYMGRVLDFSGFLHTLIGKQTYNHGRATFRNATANVVWIRLTVLDDVGCRDSCCSIKVCNKENGYENLRHTMRPKSVIFY